MDNPGNLLLAYEKKQQNTFLRELLDRIGRVESQVVLKGGSIANLATKSEFEYLARRVKASEDSLAQTRAAFDQLPNFRARLEDVNQQSSMLRNTINRLSEQRSNVQPAEAVMPQAVELFLKSDVLRQELHNQLQVLACKLNERLATCEENRQQDLIRLNWVVGGVEGLARRHDAFARSVNRAERFMEQLHGKTHDSNPTKAGQDTVNSMTADTAVSSTSNNQPMGAEAESVRQPSLPVPADIGSPAVTGANAAVVQAVEVSNIHEAGAFQIQCMGMQLPLESIPQMPDTVQPSFTKKKGANRSTAPPANRANAPKLTVTTRGRAAQARRRHRKVEELQELDHSGNPRVYVEHKAVAKRERSPSIAPVYIFIPHSPVPQVEDKSIETATGQQEAESESVPPKKASRARKEKASSSRSRKRKR